MTDHQSSASHGVAAAEARPPGVWEVGLALLLPVSALVIAGWLHFRAPSAPPALSVRSALELDLARPDALIETAALANLPRDLLAVPLLRDTLTEDFVYYYEHNADRLGLAGSLRRIAYEHDLELRDSLIRELLDQPGEVALWRGADGRFGHALMLLQRGALAQLLQPLATVALDDSQLREVGALPFGDDAIPLYRLRYNHQRTLLFAMHGDRMLVLTSPGMLLDEDSNEGRPAGDAAESMVALLTGDSPFARRFGLEPRASTHRVTVAAEPLSFGYGRFAPAIRGLGFEFDDEGWRTRMAVDGRLTADMDFAPLWKAMPIGASACAAAPVSRPALAPLIERLVNDATLAASLRGRIGGSSAACWYGRSRLHTPLLVTRVQDAGEGLDAALDAAFTQMVGALEPGLDDARFEVTTTAGRDGPRWQRVVGSNFGIHPAATLDTPDALTASHYFRVTLARHGDTLLFSLDDRLVDSALATLDRRFPPLADQLPRNGHVPAYLAPASLAQLLESEVMTSLPADIEPVFRNAAERSLLPKLRALGSHRQYALSLPGERLPAGDWNWLPVQWTPL